MARYGKEMTMSAKSAGLEILLILELLKDDEALDALAIAIKVYTEDSGAIRRLRETLKEKAGFNAS